MKKRFFYGKPAVHPEKGGKACAKIFVLTEEGYFYCEVNQEVDYPTKSEAHDFEAFDPTLYLWDGYQPIVEIDEEQAKNIELENQKNWVSKYLSWRDNYRYIDIQQMTSHYLGVSPINVVHVLKGAVHIKVDEKVAKRDPEISEEGVYECLVEHITNFDSTLEIWPENGSISERPATRTMFGRVIRQPETRKQLEFGYGTSSEILFISKHTLENIRVYLRQNTNSSQ